MNLEISIEYANDCCENDDLLRKCVCNCDKWDEDEVRSAAKQCSDVVFSHLNIKGDSVEICFLFTDDETVRVLNKTYRGIDKPTNVLSFPADPIENLNDEKSDNNYESYDFYNEKNTEKNPPFLILGSMAIAYETVVREAKNQNKKFEDHLKHLVVHSLLHLLNYDHLNESDAEKMESLEIEILKKINISNPYELN